MNVSHWCDKILKCEYVILALITYDIVYKRMTVNYFVLFYCDKPPAWIFQWVLYVIKKYIDKLEIISWKASGKNVARKLDKNCRSWVCLNKTRIHRVSCERIELIVYPAAFLCYARRSCLPIAVFMWEQRVKLEVCVWKPAGAEEVATSEQLKVLIAEVEPGKSPSIKENKLYSNTQEWLIVLRFHWGLKKNAICDPDNFG